MASGQDFAPGGIPGDGKRAKHRDREHRETAIEHRRVSGRLAAKIPYCRSAVALYAAPHDSSLASHVGQPDLCHGRGRVLTLASPVAVGQDTGLETRIDAFVSQAFTAAGPGVSMIAAKDGKVVVRKATGLANLETRTAMRPEMVFELGSVTKQFTSTAILMLAEQGKLALSDDARKYLPDFPDKGALVTIEHLLTHTSGIKSYTDDPKWLAMWRQDLTPAQVMDITKDAPLEFAPGAKWRYNNTGYTMLGAIIEKVSGLTYADFIRRHIFEPLGMSHSFYGSFSAVIPNRAAGYTRGAVGWENAPFLSMTHPYAAGSLMSNVDDLLLWENAVSSGRPSRRRRGAGLSPASS